MVKLQAVVDRLAVLMGAGLVVWGTSMFSPPAAVILSGTMLMAGALWRARL